MIRTTRVAPLLLALAALACAAGAPQPFATAWRPARIIDVHLHGYASDETWHQLPLGVVSPHLPAERRGARPPSTPRDHVGELLAAMERNRVVLGLLSPGSFGDRGVAAFWREPIAAGRIRLGATHRRLLDADALAEVARDVAAGEVAFFGELGLVYDGLDPNDPRLEPAFALAERLDVPVGIHTGTAAPRSANRGEPGFRNRLGKPGLLEDLLVRHPRLRVWLMHAGYPYLEDTIAILHQYPEVHADVSALNWLLPEVEFRRYVRALVDAGYARRLMFGSDPMRWPEAMDVAVERTASLPFLTPAQKDDLFYGNAARFFRIDGVE